MHVVIESEIIFYYLLFNGSAGDPAQVYRDRVHWSRWDIGFLFNWLKNLCNGVTPSAQLKCLEISLSIAYSFGMKTENTNQIRKFIPGARPPKKLSAADKKQLEEAVPSIKAHELAARFAKSKVKVNP